MDASTKYMEKRMAGIATDDEEGGEEEQGSEGDKELGEDAWCWAASRRRSNRASI